MANAIGQIISYTYSENDQVETTRDQLGRTESYQYDFNDNLIRITDRKGQVTDSTYDKFDRLSRIDYGDGSYTENTYDAVGRLIRIYDSVSGSIEYEYANTGCTTGCSGGAVDKVIKETNPLGVISYTYDALGRRTSMTLAGQPAVNYQYDSNSRLLGISTLNSQPGTLNFNIAYDALGRRTSLTYPNGVTTNYTYDNASQVLRLEHLNRLHEILESLNYSYDENGNRTMMQRTNARGDLPDPRSNISYNSGTQVLTFDDKSMTYDENGNLVSLTTACGITTYTWDARNRLIAISGFNADCSHLTANFKYDAIGRRTEKTINATITQYLYDGQDIVQEIENGTTSLNYIRTTNIDKPLARLTTNSSRFYQADALGSVTALTDEAGEIKTQYVYDPFGNVTFSGEPNDNPFQYTGRENDGTGLYYYRTRYYSPELQRFKSEDPIGLFGGVNLYSYVANNPVNWIDPLGLDFSSGVAVHGETINPFTSGGGGIWGVNYQNNELYTYSGRGIGLDVGVGIESVWAWGSGPWTGEFQSLNFGFLWFQGSIFWSPGEGGWFGFTFGLSAGLPISAAYEVTEYKDTKSKPCR